LARLSRQLVREARADGTADLPLASVVVSTRLALDMEDTVMVMVAMDLRIGVGMTEATGATMEGMVMLRTYRIRTGTIRTLLWHRISSTIHTFCRIRTITGTIRTLRSTIPRLVIRSFLLKSFRTRATLSWCPLIRPTRCRSSTCRVSL
jgi:hypothetical protein